MESPLLVQGATVATIATVMIMGALFLGTAFYISNQNQKEISSLNTGFASEDSLLNALSEVVNRIEWAQVETVTVQNTIVSVETSTTTSLISTTTTTSVYPAPENVTVLFTPVSGQYSFTITAGSETYSGSTSNAQSLPITPVFQGETVSISASETGAAGCAMGQTVTVRLFVNNQLVAQSTTQSTGTDAQITYTV